MDWKKLSNADRWVAVSALLLAVDLLVLPWIDVSVGPISVTSAGTGSPDGFLGVVALLMALAVAVDLVLERLTDVKLPDLPVGHDRARFLAAATALGLLILKLILHPHPSYLGAGCWVGVALGAVLALVAYRSTRHEPARAAR